jgi:hypothetical protein
VTAPRLPLRLNLGCGAYALPQAVGWENWDDDPLTPADRHLHVPPIPVPDGAVAEIYMGHLLEHLEPVEADALLRECYRVLAPGATLGVVVPDTRWVLEQYVRQSGQRVELPQGVFWELDDLDAVGSVFLYSTIQDSRHRWSYDETTLRRALSRAGFRVRGAIDRWHDPRASAHNAWSLGVDVVKPGAAP